MHKIRFFLHILLVFHAVSVFSLIITMSCTTSGYMIASVYDKTCFDNLNHPLMWIPLIMTVLPIGIGILIARIVHNSRGIYITSLLLGIFYVSNTVCLLYLIQTNYPLDAYLTFSHISETWITLNALFPFLEWYVALALGEIALLTGALVILIRWGMNSSLVRTVHPRIAIAVCVLSIVTVILVPGKLNSQVLMVIKRSLPSSQVTHFYTDMYKERIRLHSKEPVLTTQAETSPSLIIIQLESMNGFVINEHTTPELYRISKDGIFFPHIQGASVQTFRSQESILCSLIPSLFVELVDSPFTLENLQCLPRIMATNGYQTVYFQNYDVSFWNVGTFMKGIGFHDVYGTDIMDTGDPQYMWGHDDLRYLQKSLAMIKSVQGPYFAYIAIGATNHFPFYDNRNEVFEHYRSIVPYPDQKTFKDHYENSLMIQDYIIGRVYDELLEPQFLENSDIWIIGDHSFPVGAQRPGNKLNFINAYQETYLTTAVFIPARSRGNDFPRGIQREQYYSQLDFMPTILDIKGIHNSRTDGTSFASDLNADMPAPSQQHRCLISVQPYHDQFVSLVVYPKKYLFNATSQKTSEYNLIDDPTEDHPLHMRKTSQEDFAIFDTCFHNT